MEDYIMIHITFCYETDLDLTYMKNEITKCFEQRGVCVSACCCHNAAELLKRSSSQLPDILFYDLNGEQGLMRKAAIAVKKKQQNMVSVVFAQKDTTAAMEDILLEPLFAVPNKSRKQLWTYASLAYEAAMKDEDTFTYYRRPSYIKTAVQDIQYFVSEGRRTHIVSADGCNTFYKKLDEVETLMQNKNCQFLRIHKSYLVNASYIAGYSRNSIKLTNGEHLRISRYAYYKNIVELIRSSSVS